MRVLTVSGESYTIPALNTGVPVFLVLLIRQSKYRNVCVVFVSVYVCGRAKVSGKVKERKRKVEICTFRTPKLTARRRVEWNVQCTSLARGALYLQDAGKGIWKGQVTPWSRAAHNTYSLLHSQCQSSAPWTLRASVLHVYAYSVCVCVRVYKFYADLSRLLH